jgi:hypothetical protein
LLKTYALNPAFSVDILVTQKLIKKKDVKPIISHPKNNIIKLLEVTKKTILITKEFKNNKNLSTNGSYLK